MCQGRRHTRMRNWEGRDDDRGGHHIHLRFTTFGCLPDSSTAREAASGTAMRATARHALELLARPTKTSSVVRPAFRAPWVCNYCQARARAAVHVKDARSAPARQWSRQWSSTAVRLADRPSFPREPIPDLPPRTAKAEEPQSDDTATPTRDLSSKAAELGSPIRGSHTEASSGTDGLPSQRQEQRTQMSKRVHHIMDELLAKAAVASKQLNNYTGTDYSGIETLRQQIIDQEEVVRTGHTAVTVAKDAYANAISQQASSQKEVVGLLERKHSWAGGDLERYMSLIRSEHQNEQAVQAAKDELADAEKALEEARTLLEKKERVQYHEEQIWSDTIRRNSTWVTFGLMGFNIFLLLVTMVLIEPWRRRRIVREIRTALNEKSPVALPVPAVAAEVEKMIEVEKVPEVEKVVAPAGESLEGLKIAQPSASQSPVDESPIAEGEEMAGDVQFAAGAILPEEATQIAGELPPSSTKQAADQSKAPLAAQGGFSWDWEAYRERVHDLFSERQVVLKKVDVTTIALEGAAMGVAVMGLLFVLLRPR